MTNGFARPQDEDSRAEITPQGAIDLLRAGNQRFLRRKPLERSWADDVAATADGQYPYAVVLGCIDSRVPVETVFDQGIGDIFTPRVAGNIVNVDLLGSMEFACRLAGAKAVLVLGHTSCGAVSGAVGKARLGNLTELVAKIAPVVDRVAETMERDDPDFVDAVAEANVVATIGAIRSRSEVLADMEQAGEIIIVGGMYDVSTGEVRFL